jgi:hypothetical protein
VQLNPCGHSPYVVHCCVRLCCSGNVLQSHFLAMSCSLACCSLAISNGCHTTLLLI